MLEQSQGSEASSSNSDQSSQGQDQSSKGSLDSASEGGDIDFKELFSSHQQQMQQELGRRDTAIESQGKVLERVRQALTADENGSNEKLDPIDAEIRSAEAEIDRYIEAAMQAEKAGKPIPLTVNNAVRSLKFQINSLQKEKASNAKIAALEAQVKKQNDPGNQIDMQAYSGMDSHLVSALNTIYGPGEEDQETKALQFEAISKRIIHEIKDLKKEDPQMWDRIRRDRSAQQKLVNHFVKKSIPPRARQIMEEDQIRRTPMPVSELHQALAEARQLAQKDPSQAHHISKIRQEILSRMMGDQMGKGSKARMSDLF